MSPFDQMAVYVTLAGLCFSQASKRLDMWALAGIALLVHAVVILAVIVAGLRR